MEKLAHEQLKALARNDGERALAMTVGALVHELRNCMNPLGLQLALLRRRVPTPNEEVRELLDALRESMARTYQTLDDASRFADEFTPQNSERQHEPGVRPDDDTDAASNVEPPI